MFSFFLIFSPFSCVHFSTTASSPPILLPKYSHFCFPLTPHIIIPSILSELILLFASTAAN